MKRINSILLFTFLGIFTAILTNCTKEEEEEVAAAIANVDLSDGNALTDAITIADAVERTGTPPTPSSDPAAPSLSDSGDSLTTLQGEPTQLKVEITDSTSGVYIQFAGADSYLDIPISSATSRNGVIIGRISEEDDNEFILDLELPDNIEPGEFCFEFCLYDRQNRVSNVITKCVVVKEIGGAGADFITGVWNIFDFDGVPIGNEETEIETDSAYCSIEDSVVTFERTRFKTTDYLRLSFAENGAARLEEKQRDTDQEYNSTTCTIENNPEETDIRDDSGAWTYDSEEDILFFVINGTDDDGNLEQEAFDITPVLENDTMKFTIPTGEGTLVLKGTKL
ncbi:MAG: hypothetical protein AB8B61_05825 [Cyclobacteriaceae bacterium]